MSQPDETHGTECVYCGEDHPKRGGCPLPDMPYRTDAQIRRDAGLLAIADALLSDPDQMAAFRRRLGLLAHHGESALTAPAVASGRGPA